MKKSGIMVDEVSGKKYVLLRWNQKPDASAGDQVCVFSGNWVASCQVGEHTVRSLNKNYPAACMLSYRRPLPA